MTEEQNEFNIVEVDDEKEYREENAQYLVEDPSSSSSSSDEEHSNAENQESDNRYDFQINLTKASRTPISEEFYQETHVIKNTNKQNLLKSILINKWPEVGFGFQIGKNVDKDLFQINSILSESPAESCLSVGDLILQVDNESTKKFESTRDVECYLHDKDSIYLLTLNESNYTRFKSLNLSLQNCSHISEEIVIVTWNQLKHTAPSSPSP